MKTTEHSTPDRQDVAQASSAPLPNEQLPAQPLAARIRNLSVFFGKQQVVKEVSLEAPSNAVTVLIGRSGSGKTTVLRSLNRLNECFPDCRTTGHAEVLLDGRLTDIHSGFRDPAGLRVRVGMVFQTPDVLPVSIRRNITLPLQYALGLDQSVMDIRVERALCDAGLWDEVHSRLDTPAETLSGGQQQRLCLARSLAMHPAMLLLDEPTASLDNVSSRTIETLLKELKSRYPIIMVSHSLGQALRLADRLVLMGNGRIRHQWDRTVGDRQVGLPDIETLELMLEDAACCV
ncbi:ATP-binding cassette domain-containing protein [Desulfovibrio mangrovi]|uniref:phosphate ABC transporter ATP-binding protein n=1 Tax=Desulfovibrio mangrovi TaxID=2976983 RepID=UPI0022464B73|nr:ATP-binding cassette domain-containing protein [Desulfovibrio mangrovi]UZP67516.1 ATP-binding cassette domain-containing protein [Desulfovibrio mangrovi]